MIAERCAAMPRGVRLNAACETCGHTMAAHTHDRRCDVCAVLLDMRSVLVHLLRGWGDLT